MYKINFEKIKQSSTDFKGKDWLTPREINKGVYWDISDIPLEDNGYIPLEYILEARADKYKHLPIVCIDESIRDHMTQILFILKESFTDIELGFTGWKSFNKESLITLCKGEENIYKNDWPDGNKFVLEFPDKINTFIESYCDDVGPERWLDRRYRLLYGSGL